MRHCRAMSFDSSLSPTGVRALGAVDDAARTVRDVRDRLADLIAHAGTIAADTDWKGPSSRALHDRADRWRGLLVTAEGRADDVLDALSRARAEVQALVWTTVP